MKYIELNIIIIFFILLMSCERNMSKEEFQQAESSINKELFDVFLYSIIVDYYLQFESYPNSLSQLDSVYELSKNDYRYEEVIKDPFSKKHKQYLYLPLYENIGDTIPQGFYLLSAGVDRILNTDSIRQYTIKDTTEIQIFRIDKLSYGAEELQGNDLLIYKSIKEEPIIRNPGEPKAINSVDEKLIGKFISLDIVIYKLDGRLYGSGIKDKTKIISFEKILNKDLKIPLGKVNIKGILKNVSNDTLKLQNVVISSNLIGVENEINNKEELTIEAIN